MDVDALIDRFYNFFSGPGGSPGGEESGEGRGATVLSQVTQAVSVAAAAPVSEGYVSSRIEKYAQWRGVIAYLQTLPQHPQKSEAWHQQRNGLVTASDFAQALGHGKFGTQKDFIMRKVELPPFNGSVPPLLWGVKYEQVAGFIYTLRNNAPMHEFGLIQHPRLDIIGASPDGITENGIMVEIKCPWRRKIVPGEVPQQYAWQIQVQLDVCGLTDCDYIECVFREYQDLDEFVADCAQDRPDFLATRGGMEKGCLLEQINPADDSRKHEYFDITKSRSLAELLAWMEDRSVALPGAQPVFWRLEQTQTVRMTRDPTFMDTWMPELTKVWNRVLAYRADGELYRQELSSPPKKASLSKAAMSSDEEEGETSRPGGAAAKPKGAAQTAGRPVVHADGSKTWDTSVPERTFEALWRDARPHKEAMVCVARDGTVVEKLPTGVLQCFNEEWTVLGEADGGGLLQVRVVRNKLHAGAFVCYESLLEEFVVMVRKVPEQGLVLVKKMYCGGSGETGCAVREKVFDIRSRPNEHHASFRSMNGYFDAVMHAAIKASGVPTAVLLNNCTWLLDRVGVEVPIAPDVFMKVTEVQRRELSDVQSASIMIRSPSKNVLKLMELLDKLCAKHTEHQKQQLASSPCYFEQKPRVEMRYNPGIDTRRHEIAIAPKNLSFIKYPFHSNKTFENLCGEEVRVVADRVRFFCSNREWYNAKGVPYQLGIMLSGDCGTGKSSVIRAIANFTRRHVINVNFANIKTATQLKKLFQSNDLHVYENDDMADTVKLDIPVSQRLYVLEEIDAVGAEVLERRQGPAAGTLGSTSLGDPVPDQLTLGEILQVLDGNMEMPGRIVVITSNYPERLDQALIRPGRIDLMVKFGPASREAVAEMCSKLGGMDLAPEECAALPDRAMSHAEASEIIQCNLNATKSEMVAALNGAAYAGPIAETDADPVPDAVVADVVADGPVISVDMSEFVTAGIGTGRATSTPDGVRRLVVELASGVFSRFGVDTATLSSELFEAASEEPPPDAFDHLTRLTGCLPLAAKTPWLPLTSVSYRDDHFAYLAALSALNSARGLQYKDKVRQLAWLTRPFVPLLSDETVALQLVGGEGGGLDCANLEDGRAVRLLSAPDLGGDVLAFAGLESRAAAEGAPEFPFDEYVAALSALTAGAPVTVVDNTLSGEASSHQKGGEVLSVADGGAAIRVRLSDGGAELEVRPMAFEDVCVFPEGFPPVRKRDLATAYRRIRTRDTRVLDFALPCTYAELLRGQGPRAAPPEHRMARLAGKQGSFAPPPTTAGSQAVLRVLADRLLGLERENATVAGSLNDDTPRQKQGSFAPPPTTAGTPAVLQGRLLSPAQFVYEPFEEEGVFVDFGYAVFPGARDGTLGQRDSPVLLRGLRQPLVGPPDTLNTDVDHAEPPFAHPDVKPPSLSHSVEYWRLKKYSGDVTLGDASDLATFEDISGNYNAGAAPPAAAGAGPASDGGPPPQELAAAAFLAACGMPKDSTAASAEKVVRVLLFFTERTLHAKYNQLLKQENATLRLMADVQVPDGFPFGADLFKKMMAALQSDAAALRDTQTVMQQLLPAVVKALIRVGELAVAEGPQKEQYRRVDEAFKRLYMRGASPADLKGALADLNANAAFMLKYDYAIKGLSNAQTVYLRHVVQFPEAQYGIGSWATYKPYYRITSRANGAGRYLLALQDQVSSRPPLRVSPTGAPFAANAVLVYPLSDAALSHSYHAFMQGGAVASARSRASEVAVGAVASARSRASDDSDLNDKGAAGEKAAAAAAPFLTANKALLGVSSLEDVESKVLEPLYGSLKLSDGLRVATAAPDPALVSFVRQRLNSVLLSQGVDVRVSAASCLDAMPRAQACKLASAALMRVLYMLSTKPAAAAAVQEAFDAEQHQQQLDVGALNSRFEQIREVYNQGIIAPLKTMDKEDRAVYRELLDVRLLDGERLRRVVGPGGPVVGAGAEAADPEAAMGADTDMVPLQRDDDDGVCHTLDAHVEDRPASYLVVFDVPGVPRADITVETPDANTLVVSAVRRPVGSAGIPDQQGDSQSCPAEVLRAELRHGTFTRGMRFRHAIQPSGMRARLEDGVLRLTIPKAEGPALASLWDSGTYCVKLFGRSADGTTVTVTVNDYTPHFYLRFQNGRKSEYDNLVTKFKAKFQDKFKVARRVQCKDFWGFTNDRTAEFLQVVFTSRSAMRSAANWFQNAAGDKVKAYESNIEPFLRMFHKNNIEPCGWVRVTRHRPAPDAGSYATTSVRNVIASWRDLQPLALPRIAPFKVAAFDIECCSYDGQFPLARRNFKKIVLMWRDECSKVGHNGRTLVSWLDSQFRDGKMVAVAGQAAGSMRMMLSNHVEDFDMIIRGELQYSGGQLVEADPPMEPGDERINAVLEAKLERTLPALEGDPIIQIGTTIQVYGEKEISERHIFVLGTCDEIPGATVYCVDSERELLLSWSRFVRKADPDIMLGYNIFGFDMEYMYNRATELGCADEFCKLGRLRNRKCPYESKMLSSSALGDNAMKYLDVEGRVLIDVMKVVQRDHKLDSYKLDLVAEHFLRDKKNDVSPNDIFRLHRGSAADRRTVAEYCIQDCALLNRLSTKLEILANNVGMANVCCVPLSWIFMRGQGIKIFSLVAKCCKEEGFLIPVVRMGYGASRSAAGEAAADEGYEGAIVLDPIPGIYMEPVAVLDYASLYPSSMISENISHDTIVLSKAYDNLPGVEYVDVTYDAYGGAGDKKQKVGEVTCRYAQNKKGILPKILEHLLKQRKATRKKILWRRWTVVAPDGATREVVGLEASAGTDAVLRVNSQDGEVVEVPRAQVRSEEPAFSDFECAVLDGLQLAYKVTANSLYGQMGARTSPLYMKDLAASTTAVGRNMILKAKDFIEESCGGKVIYGDSVAGHTPVFIRRLGTEVCLMTVEELARCEPPDAWLHCEDEGREGKQALELEGTEVWSEAGWTPARRLIRHVLPPGKRMLRVLTGTGAVDVTSDHSLLRADGSIVRPCELAPGDDLLHARLPSADDGLTLGSFEGIREAEAYALGLHVGKDESDYETSVNVGILCAPEHIRRAFWDGLVEAVGGPWRNGCVYVRRVDHKTAAVLFALASSLGFEVTLDPNSVHSICLVVREEVDGTDDAAGCVEDRVVRIVELPAVPDQYVYDFTTDNNHFSAGVGRIVVHNTDSVFVTMPSAREALEQAGGGVERVPVAVRAAMDFAIEASTRFRPMLKPPHDLEYDKTFMPFVIFSKKRYVGNKYESDPTKPKMTCIGIVLKRRDNAQIVKTIYGGCIDIILNGGSMESAVKYLGDSVRRMLDGGFDLGELVITKALSASYKDPERIAHKVLAERIGERDPGNRPQINDRIPFVYVETPDKEGAGPAAKVLQGDRIETPDYIRAMGLRPDFKFYITNQLMKPVSQLFALVVESLPGYSRPAGYWSDVRSELEKTLAGEKLLDKIETLRENEASKLLFEPYLVELGDKPKKRRDPLAQPKTKAK
ncbi:hypothetical protein HXX76_014059 [Chlamydomonas incerta]|uniref:DNA polymerase delta catalytic subunit n=1 Tax=Chlamydomonas incerta TaxID=51695 RepID=A0A835VTN2_CHLIN|nr:hypothetical protein HXX76_014059 [Chlamydomonas incerta]|eukprot:KAG2424901.1 hypothetical protein HXX76_014059 [Chlamydomonas incerta]